LSFESITDTPLRCTVFIALCVPAVRKTVPFGVKISAPALRESSTCIALFHLRVPALIAKMASKPFPLHVTDGVKNVASPEFALNINLTISRPTHFVHSTT